MYKHRRHVEDKRERQVQPALNEATPSLPDLLVIGGRHAACRAFEGALELSTAFIFLVSVLADPSYARFTHCRRFSKYEEDIKLGKT